jgi:RecJ-like exonuclease
MEMEITPLTVWIEDVEEEIPTKLALCNTCDGKGYQALHGIALTQDDLADWSQEEKETYMDGGYNTPCGTCRGTGRINVIDEDRCTSEQIELYRKQQEQFWADEAVARSEIEHGA